MRLNRSFSLLVVVSSVVLQFFSPTAYSNLIMNGGFESGNVDWIYKGDAYLHGADLLDPAHSGTTMGYMGPYSPSGQSSISQTIATVPGETYTVDFWIASNGGDGVIYVDFGNKEGFSQYNPGGYYSYLEYGFKAVATDANTVFTIGSYGVTATFFFDDITVTHVPETGSSITSLIIGLWGIFLFANGQRLRARFCS